MLFSIFLFSTLPSKDPFTDLAKETTKKAKLNKAQSFILVFIILIFAFILSYTLVGSFSESVPLPGSDLRVAFWITFSLGSLLMILYAAPDIIKKFKSV